MSDHDIRRALAVLRSDYEADASPEETADRLRRFTDAMDRRESPSD